MIDCVTGAARPEDRSPIPCLRSCRCSSRRPGNFFPHRRSITGTPFSFLEVWLNQDVEKLWELQTVLSSLGDREKQLTNKPESFAAVDREWQGVNADMEKLLQQIEQLSRERRRVDGEL